MFDRVRRYLTPPVFVDDQEKTRSAAILNAILLTLLALTTIVVVVLLVTSQLDLMSLAFIGVIFTLVLAVMFVMRRGYVRAAGGALCFGLWLFETFLIFGSGGVRSPLAVSYVLVTVLGGLLLGGRGAMLFAGLSVLSGLATFYIESTGILAEPFLGIDAAAALISLAINLILAAALLYLADRSIRKALERAQGYAEQLKLQQERLEKVVETRTSELVRRARYVEATAEVGREAASELDLKSLLARVVTLISERFDFYQTGIFLVDAGGEWAVLQAASSPGGQRMLMRRHRLRVGQEGIVGYVTGYGEPRVALDVGRDAAHFDNPDLPETRSEMALPLKARGEILGALDVQSIEPEAFSEQDVAVLQTLADQVALAISNARLFEQAQQALEAERRSYGMTSREIWKDILRARSDWAVRKDARGLAPAGDVWRPSMEAALNTGQATLDKEKVGIPIKVRSQIIGVIDACKPDGAGEWTADEISLMETLAQQLGLALDSARLYQQTQRRASRERLASEVTARMRETLDVDTILQTAVREMREALGLAEVEVHMGTKVGEK